MLPALVQELHRIRLQHGSPASSISSAGNLLAASPLFARAVQQLCDASVEVRCARVCARVRARVCLRSRREQTLAI
jgi:hypothetical protein